MNLFAALVARVRRSLVRYPYIATLRYKGYPPLRFRLHNPTERFRVVEYGGEQPFWERFLGELRSDDIVYDIGASVGLISLAAAQIAAAGVVYAFEPDPETRERLAANGALNGLGNLWIVPWAVSDEAGELMLYSDGAAGFAPSLAPQTRQGAPTGQVMVRADSLDAALERGELPPPTVIKIDIEGAEILCLRGCRRLLAGAFGSPPRLIAVELHPEFLPDFGSSAAEVCAAIEAAGYTLSWSQQRDGQEQRFYRKI